MPAEPAGGARPPSLGRTFAVYTALRVGLMVVLSALAWLAGLPWLLAVTVGVLLAAIGSLFVLRGPMQRLSSAVAGSRGRSAGPRATPTAPGGAPEIYEDDPDGDDPYADDPPDAGQARNSSATPTSRP